MNKVITTANIPIMKPIVAIKFPNISLTSWNELKEVDKSTEATEDEIIYVCSVCGITKLETVVKPSFLPDNNCEVLFCISTETI